MGKVIFIEHDGQQHEAEAQPGESLMQCALNNLVPGIFGDCGGCATCGTCHAFVDERWQAAAGEANEDELLILDGAEHARPNSRLTCQVKFAAELDGMVLRLPPVQR